MNICQSAAISVRLLLTLFLIAAPLSAQRRRGAQTVAACSTS